MISVESHLRMEVDGCEADRHYLFIRQPTYELAVVHTIIGMQVHSHPNYNQHGEGERRLRAVPCL